MKTVDTQDKDLPFYVPCRTLSFSAPFSWLKKGWQDFRRVPWHSMTYGGIFACIGWALVHLSFAYESYLMVGVLFSVLIIGPALAFGLYDTSKQLEQNQAPTFKHERGKALREMGHELMLMLMMGAAYLFLLIFVSMLTSIGHDPAVSAVVPVSDTASLSITVIIAGLLFFVSIFALPMILDQDASAMTALNTSLNAVWCNKSAIALWALLIVLLAAIGIATALVGFVLIVPVIGYATWHAYRETVMAT